MILKASQRSGAVQLAHHLLKPENEHVELHEIRGFLSETVLGALKEAQAISCGTKCRQFLFSVSLSPPQAEAVPVEAFEAALDRIEEKMGLSGQPRVVIFHEKEGRRHAHAVWSRIDAETMTARQMSFFKTKLREISKELYLEHGWLMPKGLVDSKARDPRNFDLAEWQHAKRMGRDPRQLKSIMQECWASSDSRASLAQALEERGLYLARGDRRSHVAVTYEGDVLSIARMIGKKTKEVRAKLGDADALRSVEETCSHIASIVAPRLKAIIAEEKAKHALRMRPLERAREEMVQLHREERRKLDIGQQARLRREHAERQARFRQGLPGIWDRITGKRARISRRNDAEALAWLRRDKDQRHALVEVQLKERQELQIRIAETRNAQAQLLFDLHRSLVTAWRNRNEGLRAIFNRASPESTVASQQQTAKVQNTRDKDLKNLEIIRQSQRNGPRPGGKFELG